ncbi:hypothetical protein [Halomicrobium salinisoli]|uniref:hypothetical protein n=1 Tax=Halomicrobium salinisoli TaxID=2878391 RepID=UPI001CF05F32|nr:hypothetical protein [Halomicrobium salinisoli]
MRRTPAIVAVMLVVSAVAALPMAGVAQSTDATTDTPTETPAPTETPDGNASNASVAPGAQLAGVVGVQGAEIEGDVQSRSFGIRVAQTASNESRAAVVAEQLGDVEQRLSELEDQRSELREARENGTLSEGEYRARAARLHAESRTVQRLANQSAGAAAGIPEQALAERGVNATAIQTLRERADELSGQETAAIARSIAGERVGQPSGPAAAGERGPGGDEARGQGADAGDGANETETDRPAGDESAPSDGQGDDGRDSAGQSGDGATETTTETETASDTATDGSDGSTDADQSGSQGGA